MSTLLESLRKERFEDMVKESVLNTSLTFYPWRQMLHERDRITLKPSEDLINGCHHVIEFAQGRFDNFAAPLLRWNEDNSVDVAYAKDEYYFSRLALLGIRYGMDVVYRDCEMLYAMTTDHISVEVIRELDFMSQKYGEDEGLAFQMFMHVYYGMVAEEHYQRLYPDGSTKRTKMGKLMKMHALHRLLVFNVDPMECATECVNMPPQQVIDNASSMGLIRDVSWVPYSTPYDDPTLLPVVNYGVKKGDI